MSRLGGLLARLRAIFRPGDAEGRMEEEFRFHLEMEQARLERDGLSPAAARRQALVTFGSRDAHSETMRDERGARWLDDLGLDLRYAVRAMRRSPGFALAVALTLGVGIGVNGIVVGYVNALLFRPIPAREPKQLVALFQRDTRTGRIGELGYEDYLDYRDRSGAFAGLAGVSGVPLNVAVPAGSGAGAVAGDMVWGEMVTENYFSVLGMTPAAGRFFQASDAPQGANPFAVLSYDSWRRRFHGDPDIAGRIVRVNGTAFTITGVAPRGFRGVRRFGFWPEMWVPIGMHRVIEPGAGGALEGRGGGDLEVFGRMRPGADRARSTAAAQLFARQLAGAYPATNADLTAMLIPAGVGFDHPAYFKPGILVLSSALGLFGSLVILAIICANLANLQLARAAARTRETAIRLSLGCSRSRLVRQLLVESAVLAVPGCAIALALLRISQATDRYLTPKLQFQVGLAAGPDARVLLVTGGVAVLAVALFGLVPALRTSRANVVPVSVSAARASGGRPTRLRRSLVVTQLALSVVLLVGGMLFVRSLLAARAMDLGFETRDRALVSFNVGLQGYDERRGQAFYAGVLAQVRALPGVADAGLARPVPFDTYGEGIAWYVGDLANSRDGTTIIPTSVASDGLVPSLGLRLEDGRDFTQADSADAAPVMIVSRMVATRLWPGENPVGQQLRYGAADGPQVTVVGVVADARFAVIGDAPGGHVYLPLRQHYRGWQTLVVHTRGDAAGVLPRLTQVLAGLDPMLPTFGATTMDEAVTNGLSTSRSAAAIAGFFGALALLIASVGLYALVAGAVVERTREIGVRMALGSTPAGILGLMMGEGARLGAVGLGVGLVGAVGVARAMGGLLYGLSPGDPVTFIAVPLALGVVVLLATWLPARRAVRLDPVAALRSE